MYIMKMKRYFAPDSRQALRALRDDQEPNAVADMHSHNPSANKRMNEASGTSRSDNLKTGPSDRYRYAEYAATDSSSTLHNDWPISFVCDGQKVPDDLHLARGKLLVKEAIKLMRNLNKSLSNEELAYTFGGVVNNANI